MKKQTFRTYIIFWLTQSISQFGSAMTGHALNIWAYTQTNSEMAFSLMTFCSYVPYILVSIFAGKFIDKHQKKRIMLLSDSVAALGTVAVAILYFSNQLCIWQIYIINSIIGFMNAFQSPAQSVAVGIMVPEEKMQKASGMDSFSGNLVTIVAPMAAAALYGLSGLRLVVWIDLATFLIAVIALAFFIKIPEQLNREQTVIDEKSGVFAGFGEGVEFLKKRKGLWYIILTMAVLNFFSRLTYENILSPMLLARSGNNAMVYSSVTSVLGIGGILGGILIALSKKKHNPVKLMYYSAALSFLFGDLTMGLGRNVVVWCIAGVAASLPIPFIMAGQRVILYREIPQEIQGRIFAVRNAIQFSTIPVGILLGGFLAQYVFEPWMQRKGVVAELLGQLVGQGKGSGMAVMFLCTGILGSLSSILAYRHKEVQKLKKEKW